MALAFIADHEVCWVKVLLKTEVLVSGNDHHGRLMFVDVCSQQ
jgi:hypothetical protein